MAYSVHLMQFDGPLDLLLHLIEQAKVDIEDIFVSEITAQYLAYMDEADALDMDTASEFLTMAATLLYIKSRQLLPRPPKEEPEEDPEALLIRQLRDYKAFKEASGDLSALYERARRSLTRLPEDVPLPAREVQLDGTTMDGLYGAFLEMLARVRPDAAAAPRMPRVLPDAYTVRSQMGHIRTVLRGGGEVAFEALFSPDACRMEMIVTFMALLEMIAHGEIHLMQSKPFAPIHVRAAALNGDDADYELMDETEA